MLNRLTQAFVLSFFWGSFFSVPGAFSDTERLAGRWRRVCAHHGLFAWVTSGGAWLLALIICAVAFHNALSQRESVSQDGIGAFGRGHDASIDHQATKRERLALE